MILDPAPCPYPHGPPHAQQSEDLEDGASLAQLHAVVRGMVLLGETPLLECLLEPGNVMDCVGALEYEPGACAAPYAFSWGLGVGVCMVGLGRC